MLLGNFNQFNKNPGRAIGGPSDPTLWYKAASTRHFYPQNTNENNFYRCSFPNGSIPPYSFILAPTGGGIASCATISGSGSISPNMAGGKNMTGTLAGVGVITPPVIDLVVSMIGVLAGAGALTGTLAGSAAIVATLAGSGSVTSTMEAFAFLIATLLGEGQIDSELTAIGFMEADLYVNSGAATTKELAAEVWNTVANEYNSSGTMGQKLNEGLSEDNFLALK